MYFNLWILFAELFVSIKHSWIMVTLKRVSENKTMGLNIIKEYYIFILLSLLSWLLFSVLFSLSEWQQKKWKGSNY